jgi:hypothetical protein
MGPAPSLQRVKDPKEGARILATAASEVLGEGCAVTEPLAEWPLIEAMRDKSVLQRRSGLWPSWPHILFVRLRSSSTEATTPRLLKVTTSLMIVSRHPGCSGV